MRSLIIASLTALLFAAYSPATTLPEVLASMDASAAVFRDMTGSIKRVEHVVVLNDTSEEQGVVRMKKSGARDVRLLIDFRRPSPRTLAFEKSTAQIYYPNMQTVQIFDLGKYRALVDQFLLLGFGASATELRRKYQIKVTGEERIGGQQTTRIELVPKDASVLAQLSKAELWICGAGYPLQQKLYLPSGDYKLFTYSDVRINTGLSDAAVKLQLAKGVKREYPQK